MRSVYVYCLGTGDAFSAGGRNHAAYLIRHASGTLLLDCGPSILAALKQQKLSAGLIDVILLSHFHGDHFAGLPFLFLEYIYIEPRRKSLKIAGPSGVQRRVVQIFQAMYPDSAAEPLPYDLEFIEIEARQKLSLNGIEIDAFPVPHQKSQLSLGYEILLQGKKIVYTGDSGWTEDLVARAQGAHLLLCECSFFESRYDTHLDYPRIAENARRLGAKKILLTHLGDEVLRRSQDVELEMASDGLVISI